MTDEDYPRVLLLSSSVFNPYSGGGITLTNLFHEWPIDKIAAAHTDPIEPDNRTCQNYYVLGDDELGWCWPLSKWVGKRPSDDVVSTLKQTDTKPNGPNRSFVKTAKSCARKVISSEGFRDGAILSENLKRWVDQFQPDIIYTLLGTLGYIRLTRLLKAYTNAPVVIHMMDDWPVVNYRAGMFAPFFRRQMERELRQLMLDAHACLGICPAMCRVYQARYKRTFFSFSNALDMSSWLSHARINWHKNEGPFKILYSGSIIHNAQLWSLKDVCVAVDELNQEGVHIEFTIKSPWLFVEKYRDEFLEYTHVHLEGPPDDETVAQDMAQADLLLLPVNFDKASARFVRYSNPTKLPAYMISGTPMLVYGPDWVDQVERAQNDQWGYVVKQRDKDALKNAMRKLMTDEGLRKRLGQRAQHIAKRDHDVHTVRPAFHKILAQSAQAHIA